ncbi:MAG: Gfo/Idh/MocA family oxidoreductase [Bryobacterales bacterium]|nr:Gfo/Idh/MocA family oxidoreductase [Bryobacterales bacterium]
MPTSVNIGLVGAGLFGESHLQAYRAVRQANVAAVYDVDMDRARQRAKDFNIPRVCSSLDEICSLPEVDAIDVVTPEDDHVQPVLKALANGKHVFLEKPLATSIADCQTIIKAAKASGRTFMVGHLLRFETKYGIIQDELQAGKLGDIVSMHARRNRPKTLLPRYGRTHPAIENSIHDIDLMLWYAQRPVTRVRGYGRQTAGPKHAETFWGVIEFGNDGPLGIVETIWLTPLEAGVPLDDAFSLVGSKAVARLQLHPSPLAFFRETGYEAPDLSYDPRVRNSAMGCLRDQMAHFCDCVLENRQSDVLNPMDAFRAVRVALALMESQLSGKDVQLTDWE